MPDPRRPSPRASLPLLRSSAPVAPAAFSARSAGGPRRSRSAYTGRPASPHPSLVVRVVHETIRAGRSQVRPEGPVVAAVFELRQAVLVPRVELVGAAEVAARQLP